MAMSVLTGCAGIGKAEPAKTGNVTMPKLVGKNAAVAKDKLERLGFADDRIKLSPQGHVFVAMPSHWVVTDQSEKPGGQVSLQELIVLAVAK
jgi:PASTA domain.